MGAFYGKGGEGIVRLLSAVVLFLVTFMGGQTALATSPAAGNALSDQGLANLGGPQDNNRSFCVTGSNRTDITFNGQTLNGSAITRISLTNIGSTNSAITPGEMTVEVIPEPSEPSIVPLVAACLAYMVLGLLRPRRLLPWLYGSRRWVRVRRFLPGLYGSRRWVRVRRFLPGLYGSQAVLRARRQT